MKRKINRASLVLMTQRELTRSRISGSNGEYRPPSERTKQSLAEALTRLDVDVGQWLFSSSKVEDHLEAMAGGRCGTWASVTLIAVHETTVYVVYYGLVPISCLPISGSTHGGMYATYIIDLAPERNRPISPPFRSRKFLTNSTGPCIFISLSGLALAAALHGAGFGVHPHDSHALPRYSSNSPPPHAKWVFLITTSTPKSAVSRRS